MKKLILSGLAAALAVTIACGGDKAPAKLNIGDAAPGFQTVRADGTPAQFPAAWAGKPLVIRFWADWCQYCEGEMKAIENVYQRHRGKGLQVLAINAGQDKPAVALTWHGGRVPEQVAGLQGADGKPLDWGSGQDAQFDYPKNLA